MGIILPFPVHGPSVLGVLPSCPKVLFATFLSQVLVLPSPPRSRNNVNNNNLPALTPPSAARWTSSSPLTTVLPAGPGVLSTCSALLQLTLELSVPPLHALGQAPRPSLPTCLPASIVSLQTTRRSTDPDQLLVQLPTLVLYLSST